MKKQCFLILTIFFLSLIFPLSSWVSAYNLENNTFLKDSVSTEIIPHKSENLDLFIEHSTTIYNQANLAANGLDQELFKKALIGYYNLKKSKQLSTGKSIITIIDFSKKSSQKRLWIIDLNKNKLLFHTLVAHGQGSGLDLATNFSDTRSSNQSSLGFYLTSETYIGKHGLSMRLDGLDKGFNSNARARAVVVHGAEYVSQDFINKTGRLGRSHGCPALPKELTSTIINTIKGKTCLFISGKTENYKSNFLDQELAISNFISSTIQSEADISN